MAQQQGSSRGGKAADVEMGGGGSGGGSGGARGTWACAVSVAATGLAGAAVLVWWAVAFHPGHEQQWMVPVGLVLLGTPLVTWLSLFSSGACRRTSRLHAAAGPDLPLAVVPER